MQVHLKTQNSDILGMSRGGEAGLEGRERRVRCPPTNQFIFPGKPIILLILYQSIMSKTLLLLLLLTVAVLSSYCEHCKPAVKIKNCYQPHCYRCGRNQVFNPATLYCDCIEGTYPVRGFCTTCPSGYVYDVDLLQCKGINPCGLNQHIVNGTCQCLPGLIVIQNFCQRCPENQTYFKQYDACRCKLGFTLVNNTCIFIKCLDNQVYSTTTQQCVCAFGYYFINGTCSQCAKNEVYDATTQSCSPFIAPLCGLNEYWYECCCFCQVGYVKINGECNTCPEHSSYDAATDSCVCDQGYYFVNEGALLLPVQIQNTGSSFTSNPGYAYSYKAPYNGNAANQPIIVVGSNYDASGINTNRVNINTIYNQPYYRGN